MGIFGGGPKPAPNVYLHCTVRPIPNTVKLSRGRSTTTTTMKCYFGFGWNDLSAKGDLADAEWTSIAMVYDEKVGKRIYLNGKLDAEQLDTRKLNCHGGQLTLGKVLHCGGFVGELCGAQCLSVALSEDEVRSTLEACKPADDGAGGISEAADLIAPICRVPGLPARHYADLARLLKRDETEVCQAVSSALAQLPDCVLEEAGAVGALLELLQAAADYRLDGLGDGQAVAGPLRVTAARFGWATDLWDDSKLGEATEQGSFDVTDKARSLIDANDELHVNPGKARSYMNRTFLPTVGGAPIPRKLSVRFAYGEGEPITITTPAIPYETVALHVTRLGSSPRSRLGDYDEWGTVRSAASVLSGLSRLADGHAVAATELLRSPSPFVRGAALGLLGKLERPGLERQAGRIGELAAEQGGSVNEAVAAAMRMVADAVNTT